MRISLRIYFQDGSTRDVVCNAADMVAFEDKFDVSVVKIGTDARIGWLVELDKKGLRSHNMDVVGLAFQIAKSKHHAL